MLALLVVCCQVGDRKPAPCEVGSGCAPIIASLFTPHLLEKLRPQLEEKTEEEEKTEGKEKEE